jgi:peptidyl-prolyl cis-trans isomerase C
MSIADRGCAVLFSLKGPIVRWLLTFVPAIVANAAIAQVATQPMQGLPPPDIRSDASLQAALAELDRSADTVVAEVGPHKITWGNIADTIRTMPPIVGNLPFPALYQRIASQLVEQEALVLRGESAGLDKDPAVRRREQNAADQALAADVVRRSLAPDLTDKALRETFNKLVADKPAPEEVRARIIVVASREEADGLIQRLAKGADFADLARDLSNDGTAPNGGDLGYVRLDMVSPEIGSVMFALAPGQTTAYPVKSRNLWFIVRVEARRQPPAPTFEAARSALQLDVSHAGAAAVMREAVKLAPVKYYGLTGREVPNQKLSDPTNLDQTTRNKTAPDQKGPNQ